MDQYNPTSVLIAKVYFEGRRLSPADYSHSLVVLIRMGTKPESSISWEKSWHINASIIPPFQIRMFSSPLSSYTWHTLAKYLPSASQTDIKWCVLGWPTNTVDVTSLCGRNNSNEWQQKKCFPSILFLSSCSWVARQPTQPVIGGVLDTVLCMGRHSSCRMSSSTLENCIRSTSPV